MECIDTGQPVNPSDGRLSRQRDGLDGWNPSRYPSPSWLSNGLDGTGSSPSRPSRLHGLDGYGLHPYPLVRESRGPIPKLVDMALAANQGIKVGEGTATWYNIHIDDLLDFYALLIKKVLNPEIGATKSSPYSKFYFMISEEFQWGELAEVVAKALHERGALPTPEVRSLSVEEAKKFFAGAAGLGSNMFCIATRAKELGWSPKHLQWKKDAVADVELRLKTLGKI